MGTAEIELTRLIPCLHAVFAGHSFHMVGFVESQFNDGIALCMCIFMQNCAYDRQKRSDILASDNVVLFHKSLMTVT